MNAKDVPININNHKIPEMQSTDQQTRPQLFTIGIVHSGKLKLELEVVHVLNKKTIQMRYEMKNNSQS